MTHSAVPRASVEFEVESLFVQLLDGVVLAEPDIALARSVVQADVIGRRAIPFDRNEPFAAYDRSVEMMAERDRLLVALVDARSDQQEQQPRLRENVARQRAEITALRLSRENRSLP